MEADKTEGQVQVGCANPQIFLNKNIYFLGLLNSSSVFLQNCEYILRRQVISKSGGEVLV